MDSRYFTSVAGDPGRTNCKLRTAGHLLATRGNPTARVGQGSLATPPRSRAGPAHPRHSPSECSLCPTAWHQYWHWPVLHLSWFMLSEGAVSCSWFALTPFYGLTLGRCRSTQASEVSIDFIGVSWCYVKRMFGSLAFHWGCYSFFFTLVVLLNVNQERPSVCHLNRKLPFLLFKPHCDRKAMLC